ncbi:MAG: ROK family protein [Terriglobia bacterium]
MVPAKVAPAKDVIVGIDMGGTSLRALVVNSRNDILAVEKTPTNVAQKPEGLIRDLAAIVEDVITAAGLRKSQLRAVSIGAPGAVDPEHGVVYHAPNLGWNAVPLGASLGKLLHVPVFAENDVNVGVVGEHSLGAGKGAEELVGIFVGTGIGGGIISHGKLYLGMRGAAAEVGHMIVQVDGPVCGCGNHGCIEALASRTAMERDVRAAIRAGQKSCVLKLMEERGKDRMTSSIIQRALKRNDPVMSKVMKRAQYYLGMAVASVVNLLDPECIVMGGGIAERLGESFVAPIRKTAYENFLRRHDAERVKIVTGTLGDNAGPLGAVVLARKRLQK